MSNLNPSFDLAPYSYREGNLREIAFPLGGIGTGCVSLDGRGGLRDWEIFNRPNKNLLLQHTFPALWYKTASGKKRALTLLGPRVRDWMGEGSALTLRNSLGTGNLFNQEDGLPCFDEVEFHGTFPFARVDFKKEGCPLAIQLHAFNPFIPLDERSSSFPGACLIYKVTNTSDEAVDFTVAWSMRNPIGEMAPRPGSGKECAQNEFVKGAGWKGISFTNPQFGSDSIHSGTAVLATDWPDVTYREQWHQTEWFDALQEVWARFRDDGTFDESAPRTSDGRWPGSLGCRAKLAPGESAEIPFFIGWVMPQTEKYWFRPGVEPTANWTPWYATQWPTAPAAADEFFARREELTDRTRKFEDAFYSTTLPVDVLERVGSSLSILHSPTVLRLEDGTFWAWEGCDCDTGCCSGTCSHVWNYAVAHAHLFPAMQWNFRRAEYTYSFNCGVEGDKGALNFRVPLPLDRQSYLWHAASDGQLGGIVQLYRDWRLSGDDDALKSLWPAAKRALGYAWVQWDRDRDGLVDGDMHNTYDINFQGPNPLTQFYYLAALRAADEIASHLGETTDAAEYRRLYESGRALSEKAIWNGEFFVQTHDCLAEDAPKYQHGIGCLSDQLFGQLAASLAGLGDLAAPAMIRTALEAIHQHNFLSPLGDHENVQRTYASADEPGLILCTWPNGGRPKYPFPYSDEVWTGIEYQVASHMAYVGMVDEALAVVSGIRKRYDGARRNPFNEYECGSHYARALASYGVFLALTGTSYDGRTRKLSVQPKQATGGFQTFVCTPHGWGVARGVGDDVELEILGS
jgi:uncharacterized protein (DUF608 family)